MKQMWSKAIAGALLPWRMIASRRSSSVSASVNSALLRSLKQHYLEKVSPPSPFTVVKGSLESGGPVLKRTHGVEEISISVVRFVNVRPGGEEGDDDDGNDINQLFLHVDVSKPGQMVSLHFVCGLYPDASGIHSVFIRREEVQSNTTKYNGPIFQDLDERMRDALHGYIEERGINESLFPFLQAWLYVKDHRKLIRWFKTVGTFINEPRQASDA